MTTPAGWQEAALGDVCQVISGATPKTGVPEYWGGNIPWITPNDLSKDRSQTLSEGERSLTEAGYDSCSARLAPAGSVIVSSRAPVGYVAIAGAELCTNQGCKTAVPPDHIDPIYLYWYLIAAKPDLEARASGTTFKEISGKRFAETRLRWPDLQEQRRIINLLEDHLSRLDAARRELSTCEIRAVALQESWLRQHLRPPIDDNLSRVGDILTDVRGGWSRSSKHTVATGGVPYLKMNNITRRGRLDLSSLVHVDATAPEIEKYGAQPGDVLFNSKNSGDLVGKTSVADHRVAGFVINENIMRLRFSERVHPDFAAMWFLGPQMRSAIMGAASASTNVAAVYQNQLLEFPIWTPSLDIQRTLVSTFEEVRAAAERLTTEALRLVHRGDTLRRSLLAAALSGRLTGDFPDHDQEALG